MKDTGNSIDWDAVWQRIAAANAALADLDDVPVEVVQQIWARRAAQLAQVPPIEEESERTDLVLFRLGRELYGLDARHVFDIRPAELITRVPRVPAWVAGVTNLRGRIFSVVDLQRFFGLPHTEPSTFLPHLIVVESAQMELALLVDEVLAVEVLSDSRIQQASDTIRGLPPAYVRGVVGWQESDSKDGLLVVLDLPALLADERLVIDEEVS